jgi:hypothetical protein
MRRERKLLGVPMVQSVRPYGLGIDVAKDFHAICLLLPGEKEIERIEFECDNTPSSLRKAKARLLRLIPPASVQNGLSYTLESTATYHCPLVRSKQGIRYSLVRAKQAVEGQF